METVTEDCESAEGTSVDTETAREHIRERGERIRKREQARALRRLRERRSLSEHERRVIRRLAAQLTDELLAVPEAHLQAVEREETDDFARVVLKLFSEE